jgi:hypothetical protein
MDTQYLKLATAAFIRFFFHLLGAFAELREAPRTFIVSVRLEQLGSQWSDFHEISNFMIFRKCVEI